ncbi:PucR family transcriptional regulator [Anaerobium acetethylicum]|uniref:PucR C-terminal helix-turn-helix domain-containing protein n=1 Tax=Anaerobium acetethylicum TaxID=1619234 RepID=A0A1D3TWA2_9FIRM|nr:helix-turn-helix domain-containing protein [Anaerobium acetethylicum]SCP98489.1 PucR C-terminal helix-turn-helix domain-containing protein [Anaerobium acetethylicum]
MELFAVTDHLSDYKLSLHGNKNLNIDISTIKFFTQNQKQFHNKIIYMGGTECIPGPDTPGQFAFLCYGPPCDWSVYEHSSFPILYVEPELSSGERKEFDPLKLFNQIQDVLQDIQQINAGLHMLINAFFTEQGLQYLADVAYQVFGNPLFIIDNNYKYLAISSGIMADSVFASEENKEGYIRQQGLAFIKQAKIDEQIRKQNSPVYFKNPLHEKGMLADAITIHNIEVGHVMLYELDQPFQEFDSVMLHRTSRIISMELQKNSFLNANKGFLYSYFLADLLDNPEINYAAVKERLSVLDYDLKEEQYILVIPARSYRNSKVRLDVIVDQLHQILPSSIFAVYENTIAILISRSRKDGIKEQEYKRLIDFLKTNNLTSGMSNFFYDLKDARRFYQQALKSVELGQKLGVKSPIHYYSDNYLYHIFEMCESQENIHFFIHPGMLKLLEYDQNHGTDFLLTLHEYLESPGQPTQISKRLHIHKNTLLYRMDKIRGIMDCRIESGDEFLSFGLSYKIMKYLKLL